MKLLVFAQTPPPVHGQSMMVDALVRGLANDPDIKIFHVNPRLSRDHADIGQWRLGKLFTLLAACVRTLVLRLRHGRMFFYYVPAPARRSALYRDWAVMLLCRPFFRGLVLHWHASGLGAWVVHRASAVERGLTRQLLGRADLAIILGEALRDDAAVFAPRRVTIVRNGIADPCPNFVRLVRNPAAPFEAVFLGLCIAEKGLFDAITGVAEANRLAAGTAHPTFRLTVAGSFPILESRKRFEAMAYASGAAVRHVGFVTGADKHALLAQSDALIFPSIYPHETQGLVVAEALAYDLPLIITRWRAVHEALPATHVYVVEPGHVDQIANALLVASSRRPPAGASRRHFLEHLTIERHIATLKASLLQINPPGSAAKVAVG